MRVISGSARGLKLKSPEGLNTRPTADRIKESLSTGLEGNINFIKTRLKDDLTIIPWEEVK